jgi:hypothetical protein
MALVKRSKHETHAVRHQDGSYHVDPQEWSQVDHSPEMALGFTERGAKKRATQLNKYHEDDGWRAVPSSPLRY